MPSWSTFQHLERGRGLLDILFIVLQKENGFPLQQEIESIFSPVDFQKSVDDEDDEKDAREDRQIDG
jgi:hypothetical protein